MISSATLTYSRYNPRTFSGQSQVRPQESTKQTEAGTASVAQTAPKRRSLFGRHTEVATTTAQETDVLSYLVNRLNNRINPSGKELRFQLEETRAGARINLMNENKLVSSFGREEIPSLENNIHDMAGFHFNQVT